MNLRPLYEELLCEVKEKAGTLGKKKLTLFHPMNGQLSTGELMIVGRAVNGWIKEKWTTLDSDPRGWLPSELVEESFRNLVLEKSYHKSHGNECPLLRVTQRWKGQPKYNYSRSAFWRVIKRVLGELQLVNTADSSWPSHVIWSELYKISPAGKGNPSTKLKRIQQEVGRKLLCEEIASQKPKRLLLMTGYSWVKPFQTDFTILKERRIQAGSMIEWAGEILVPEMADKISVVVVPHPQGKKEKILSREVADCFRDLG